MKKNKKPCEALCLHGCRITELILMFVLSATLFFILFFLTASAEPLKVYLENQQVLSLRLRPAGGIIQYHSGDTISFVEVSAGVTYFSEMNLAYYSASLPKNNQPISLVVFPFTPAADGVIVVDDSVDGTLTDLKVYFLDESGSGDDPGDVSGDDPDNPGSDDPDTPGTDDPPVIDLDLNFIHDDLNKIFMALRIIILLLFVQFAMPLTKHCINILIKGKD